MDLIAIIGLLGEFLLLAKVVKAHAVEVSQVTPFGQYSLTR